MLRNLIAACLSRRPLVLISFLLFLAGGYAAFTKLNIEAYPDPAPPIVEIIAQYPGQSAEEVERYVTIPIEIALSSTPGLTFIRSTTLYALGFLRLQFEYGRDYYFVRQQVINRLKDASLPAAVTPVISPAGGISEIMRYQIHGPAGMDMMQLKTLQDWVVERKLRTVPGVADVAVLGGRTKEFQAEVDLNRMMAYGLTLPQILQAITASNANVGGRTISMGEQSVNVRGLGVVRSVDDIKNIVLAQQGGSPVLLSDVAKVQIGFAPRLGIAGRDDKTDQMFGIVLMQKLERTMDVVQRVHAAIERMNTDGSLPPGVQVEPFYDRGELVAVTIHTVLHNMLFGIALIFLIQWVFLGDLRCALIVSATIPVALLLAVIFTVLRGESGNLLSIGAIDLGIIVDSTVIMVENVFRHLAHEARREFARPEATLSDKLHRVLTAAVEVDKPVFFSVLITIAAFIPLFTMQGVEGQIFGPMSRTYAYALLGAIIATFTVTPVLSSLLLPAHVSEVETFLVRQIRRVYQGVLPSVIRRYRISIAVGLIFLVTCGVLGARLGTEFLPKLEEGNMWIRALLPPTITLEAGEATTTRIRNIIKSYAPVRTVVSEQGRGEDATDPDGFFVAEFFVPLKPFDEWPAGLTKEKLVKQLSAQLDREFVGIDFNFSQYIEDNIEEALSGVKGENSVKIFGRDLATLEQLSRAVRTQISGVRGVTDPGGFNLLGQPNLVVRIDRAKAARYGFSVGDINAVVQAAIGGQEVSRVYEGEMNFALTVRLAPEYRLNVDAIRSIPVALPNGDPKSPTAYISLGDLGEVKLETGAAYIYRENGSALRAAEIQCARPRSRLDGCRGAAACRQGGGAAARLQHGMVRRIRRAGRGPEAARRHRADQPAPDLHDALWPVHVGARKPAGFVGHPVRGLRRNSRALCRRPQFQRLCRGRLHLAVRRFGDGRHPARVLHPPRHRGGYRQRGGHHVGGLDAHAAGVHDRPVRLHRPRAGGNLDRHRLSGAAAAGLRHRRRHAAVAVLQPAGDPDAVSNFHALRPGHQPRP